MGLHCTVLRRGRADGRRNGQSVGHEREGGRMPSSFEFKIRSAQFLTRTVRPPFLECHARAPSLFLAQRVSIIMTPLENGRESHTLSINIQSNILIKHNKTLQARSIVVYCMRLLHSQSKNVSICTRCRNGEGKTNLADRERKERRLSRQGAAAREH